MTGSLHSKSKSWITERQSSEGIGSFLLGEQTRSSRSAVAMQNVNWFTDLCLLSRELLQAEYFDSLVPLQWVFLFAFMLSLTDLMCITSDSCYLSCHVYMWYLRKDGWQRFYWRKHLSCRGCSHWRQSHFSNCLEHMSLCHFIPTLGQAGWMSTSDIIIEKGDCQIFWRI